MDKETFADYGIKIPYRRIHGNVKTVCPKCKTSGRTHPEDRSLSVNLDAAIWNCHYCGWSGGLRGYDRSNIKWNGKKDYVRPDPIKESGLSQKLINYMSLRGISLDTLKKMHIAEGLEFMPQVGKEMNTVQFPYYLDGELVNIKYRTGDKKFKMVQGAELIPYNIDSIKDCDTAFLVEGECYPPDTQVLTRRGWVRFPELVDGDMVAQWENGIITFAKPLAIVRKPFKGDLVEFKNGKNNYYSLTTPKHNLVVEHKGFARKVHAEDICSQVNIPRCGFYDGQGIPLSDDYIRLFIAICADFHIADGGKIYGHFSKQRKIDRSVELMRRLGIPCRVSPHKDATSNVIAQVENEKLLFKEFPIEWLSQISVRQAQIILDELVVWDGNSVRNRTMKEFNTKSRHNAVWVQTLCHLSGMMSKICRRRNQWGEWYKVSMLFKDHSTIHRGMRTDVSYDGMVYCCTMPAGTLLIRQNDLITVSGNCDALSFVEAGIDNVISVPNGANKNLEWLDDFMEWFDDKKTIYIAVDNDEKGVMLKEELIRRFGPERCMVVNWSDGCKDANDQLRKYGKQSLRQCVDAAQDVKVGGIYYLEDYEKNLDMLYHRGAPKGCTVGWPNFDDLISFTTKRIMIVTGIPSHGKSAVMIEIAIRLNLRYGWKAAFFSPESMPMESHAQELIQVLVGKSFNPNFLHMSESEYQMGKDYVRSNFFHIMPEDNQTVATILEKAQFLVRRRGIKMLVIDPYSSIDSDFGNQSETNYIRAMLEALRNFAIRNDLLVCLVAHPTKIRKDKDHDGIPTMYDVSGSAHFLNKTDYGIVVYRDFDNDYTLIKVEKVKSRFLGHKGEAFFKFNINNGRYTPWGKDLPVAWDNTNWLLPEEKQQPESEPSPQENTVESNYDFWSEPGDDCPF